MALPGSIYRNGNRYWWSVKLPGEAKRTSRPLIPEGAQRATVDSGVAQAVAEAMWEKANRKGGGGGGTVGELVGAYLAYVATYYPPTSRHPVSIRQALTPLSRLHGAMPAEDYRPRHLEAFREAMMERWGRKTINIRVRMIVRMFKWGVAKGMIPASTHAALACVEGLRAGQGGAREYAPIGPAHPVIVEEVARAANKVVGAMIRLQMLTGMRSGEMVRMRGRDIDRTGQVWMYRPSPVEGGQAHKTEHHGAVRVVPIGPKGQKILRPLLKRAAGAFLFSPREAVADHLRRLRDARKTPVQPSQVDRRVVGAKQPGEVYTTGTYGRAVKKAIGAANRARKARGEEPLPEWHPHQLRHTAATLTRKHVGRDAARALLGQKTLGMIDLYAEIDEALATEAAAKLG